MGDMTMVYTFSKVKGGGGTTTVSTHAAVWLAKQSDSPTLLIDSDKICRSSTRWHEEREKHLEMLRADLQERIERSAKPQDVKRLERPLLPQVDLAFATGEDVVATVYENLGKYANIVIDAPGHDDEGNRGAVMAAGMAGGVVLCPVPPRGVDVWAAPLVRDIVQKARWPQVKDGKIVHPGFKDLRLAYFLTRADVVGSQDDNDVTVETLGQIQGADLLEARIGYRKAIGASLTHGLTCWELPHNRRSREASAEINALMEEIHRYATSAA